MAILTIGSLVMPDDLAKRGHYLPPVQEALGTNGRGLDQASVTYSMQIAYDRLPKAHFVWWYTTLLTGGLSREFSSTNIVVDALGNNLSVFSLVVHRPTFSGIKFNQYYEDVVVRITDIFLA